MKKTLYVVTLEPIEQRYTKQWHGYWSKEFSKDFNVIYIDGPDMDDKIDKGRFLDINKTNYWKAVQVQKIAQLFMDDKIRDEDNFIFMDGWSFGITALKYMLQLNNIKSKIYTFLHAGSWDKHDFISQAGLGRWASYNECGWLRACDGHFVATKFHKQLINKHFNNAIKSNKIHIVGFPMNWDEEIRNELGFSITQEELNKSKKDLIVFPHRLDKEKQPEQFMRISKLFPKVEFVKTLDITKTKSEYYHLMVGAKIAFSSSLQETYGIGTVEAMFLGAIPLVPNRLSYVEMYDPIFRYKDIPEARQKIKYFIQNYNSEKVQDVLKKNINRIRKQSLESISKMAKVIQDDK